MSRSRTVMEAKAFIDTIGMIALGCFAIFMIFMFFPIMMHAGTKYGTNEERFLVALMQWYPVIAIMCAVVAVPIYNWIWDKIFNWAIAKDRKDIEFMYRY